MIYFGTDGWRGIVADDFTYDNVRLVVQAVCEYVRAESQSAEPTLVIGYDTRFMSDRFAREAACVAAGNGLKVLLTESFAPTPAVSYAIVDKKTSGGVMITASHNDYRYNGVKFKAAFGGSALPATTRAVEKILAGNVNSDRPPAYLSYEVAESRGLITTFDPKEPYLSRLKDFVDTGLLGANKSAVVVDNMYGAGRGYLGEFLRRAGCQVEELNDRDDPYFDFSQPEPILSRLAGLIDRVKGKRPLGLALDGDADRIGAVDFSGEFIDSHQIFALLLRYLHEVKGYTGSVVKTVTTTGMIDKMAADYGLELHETPVGFKYVCDLMLEGRVLIGGEESGGLGIQGHIPERDGVLMGALLVELMNYYGELPSDIWQKMQKKYGRFCYARADISLNADQTAAFAERLKAEPPSKVGAETVFRIDDRDGCKLYLSDNSWLMIRPSGTENIVRVYAEADSPDRVGKLLREGEALVRLISEMLPE